MRNAGQMTIEKTQPRLRSGLTFLISELSHKFPLSNFPYQMWNFREKFKMGWLLLLFEFWRHELIFDHNKTISRHGLCNQRVSNDAAYMFTYLYDTPWETQTGSTSEIRRKKAADNQFKSKKNKFNFKIIDWPNELVKCTKSARRVCWSHPCFPIKLYFSTISYCCCSYILFYWKRLYWSICRKVSIYESDSRWKLDYQLQDVGDKNNDDEKYSVDKSWNPSLTWL